MKWFGTCTDIDEQRRAADTQRYFGEVSRELARSRDLGTSLQTVARLAVPRIADWCAIDLLEDDGALHRVAVVAPGPREGRARERAAAEVPARPLPPRRGRRGAPEREERVEVGDPPERLRRARPRPRAAPARPRARAEELHRRRGEDARPGRRGDHLRPVRVRPALHRRRRAGRRGGRRAHRPGDRERPALRRARAVLRRGAAAQRRPRAPRRRAHRRAAGDEPRARVVQLLGEPRPARAAAAHHRLRADARAPGGSQARREGPRAT